MLLLMLTYKLLIGPRVCCTFYDIFKTPHLDPNKTFQTNKYPFPSDNSTWWDLSGFILLPG